MNLSINVTSSSRRSLLSSLSPRVRFVLVVVVYIGVFLMTYRTLVAPIYEYWGLGYNDVPLLYILSSWVLGILPAFWISDRINKPSDLFCIILYLLIYIPPLFVVYHSTIPYFEPEDVLLLNVNLFIGMMLVMFIPRRPCLAIQRIPLSAPFFIFITTTFALSLVVYLLFTIGQHAKFTLDFHEIYEIRAQISSVASSEGYSMASYATNWLSGFFIPLCFAIGIKCNKKPLVIIGLIAPFFLYSLTAMKGTLFTPFYMLLIYFLLKYRRNSFAIFITLFYIAILLFGTVISFFLSQESVTKYVAMVHTRTFSVPAQLIGQYFDFFSKNQVTYLSHVKGFNMLFDYPYGTDIAHLIGTYYYDVFDLGSNAAFWAADGLAGFGLIGIILLSFVSGTVLWLLDSFTREFDVNFMALLCAYIVIAFSCVSIFTTILSCGLLFVLVSALYWPEVGILRMALKKYSVSEI